MQRPRRTSEFYEELGTATKRQTRATQRPTSVISPMPATGSVIKKFKRQSRLPTRSLDPSTAGSSAVRKRPSPLSTPITPRNCTRELFSVEKPRGAVGGAGLALHNDKKWIQEKIVRITEYLRGNAFGVLGTDFFDRGGLRQMSIKQFVAIINHFLRNISGTRLTVGDNHVNDIVNVLQKLRYPHQVNKSWLKTPNTQHSFGNVLLLLDFLLDFEQIQFDDLIALPEPSEVDSVPWGEVDTQISDIEFQEKLLQDTAKGFTIWDKQDNEGYNQMLKQTADLMINKKCGLRGKAAVDLDLEKIRKTLDPLKARWPNVRIEGEQQCQELNQKDKNLLQSIEFLTEKLEYIEEEFNKQSTFKQKLSEAIENMERDIAELKKQLENQTCTVEQLNKLIAQKGELEFSLACKKRSLNELQEMNDSKEVTLSRSNKQLTDQIEKFNKYTLEIVYSHHLSEYSDVLQLPLKPTEEDLRQSFIVLKDIHTNAVSRLQQDTKECHKLEEYYQGENQKINTVILPRTLLLTNTIAKTKNAHEVYEEESKNELQTFADELNEIEMRMDKVTTALGESKKINKQNREKIQRLELENEETMKNAETKHATMKEERKNYLNQYEQVLDEANENLLQLTVLLEQNAVDLPNFKREFQNA